MSRRTESDTAGERWLSRLHERISEAGFELTSHECRTGISYRYAGKRVFKLVNSKHPVLEVNYEPQERIPGYEAITPETAAAKHMGTMVGLYKGDAEGAFTLVASICRAVADSAANIRGPARIELPEVMPLPSAMAPPPVACTKFQPVFHNLLEALGLLPLERWNCFELSHSNPASVLDEKARIRVIEAAVGKRSGLYVYARLDGQILYVGKAKSLKGRLKSHFIESFRPVGGDTRHRTWHRFFSSFPEPLKLYWVEIESEKDRQILEKMVQQQLKPIFDDFATQCRRYCKHQEKLAKGQQKIRKPEL